MGKQLGCQCLAGRNKTCFAFCLCREYSSPRGRWTFRQAALSQLLDVSKVHIIIIITDIYIGFSNGRIFCLFCTFARKTTVKKTFAITWILMSVQNLNFMYIYLLFTKNILNAVEFVCFSFFLKNYTNFEVYLKKRYITQYQGTIINITGFCSIALLIIFMCLYSPAPALLFWCAWELWRQTAAYCRSSVQIVRWSCFQNGKWSSHCSSRESSKSPEFLPSVLLWNDEYSGLQFCAS